MNDLNHNNTNTEDRSKTETPGIPNIEEILSLDKKNRDDRDSVDTLELIRDSADLTKRSTKSKQKLVDVVKEIDRPVVAAKELSTISNNYNYNDEDTPLELEIPNETNFVISTSKFYNNYDNEFKDTPSELEFNNETNLDNPSRQSISSTQSSLNLGPNVYPLSIVEKPAEKTPEQTNEKTDEEQQEEEAKYKIDKNVADDEIETADLAHLEPKLRDAWIKMRKLDKILERAYHKERMIKKETIKLIEKNRADLEVLRLTSDHKESKQEAENTAHFLALSYFDLDDEIEYKAEDVKVNNDEPSTPVFKTQVLDDLISNYDEPQSGNSIQNIPKRTESIYSENTSSQQKKGDSIKSNTTKTTKSEKSIKKNAKNSNDKDFIKRNIQLVQDAGGALAMTEEEKARLNELLLDAEDSEEKNKKNFIKEGADDNATYLVEYNPFSVALAEGDGFTPDRNELQRLREIDSKLENKLNNSRLNSESLTTISEQFKGISAFSVSGKASSKYSLNNMHNIDADSYLGLFQSESRQIRLNDEFDENEFGDKFIREARITREQENRLRYIDSQLEKLKIPSQSNGDLETLRSESATSCLISQQQLKLLLQECANELSEEGSISHMTNKLDTLKEEEDLVEENASSYFETNNNDRLSIVPVLNENLIQSLLEQAKLEGIYAEPEKISSEPVQSFYEEALEIVNSYRKLTSEKLETNKQNETLEVDLVKEDFKLLSDVTNQILKEDSETDEESDSKTYVSTSPQPMNINGSYKYSNGSEDALVSNKLPPLYTSKSNKEDSNETGTSLNEARSSSSMSNLSSTSTSSLPKISSRYLPK